MRHLNYNHLYYFWTIAEKGSMARAAEELHLTPQTISGQIKLLEEEVGESLFHRVGRGLVLSDAGELVKQYADEIFSLGAELVQQVRDKEPGSAMFLKVGIVDTIPKLVAYRILQPSLELEFPVRLICREGNLERLLSELAVHSLDLVLSDRSLPTGLNVKAFNHRLGTSEIALFAHRRRASKYARNFPASLNQAPFLLPLNDSILRRSLEDWFDQNGITPQVIAEFDDSALLKVFGQAGSGIFPAPVAMTQEVEQMYNARSIGTAKGITETYYAISTERKLRHQAVIRINDVAHGWLLD